MADTIKIVTRKSQLALWQTRHVIATLRDAYPDHLFEEVLITTKGDVILDKPLAQIGDKGLFTFELEEMLRKGEVDMAVHSLKDLPTELPRGLEVGAVLARANPHDALVSRSGKSLSELPAGAVIGTSSLRRAAQLKQCRPDLIQKDIRGNVETRLKKMDDGQYDATMLAAAGLMRLGLGDRITELLDVGWFYAVGQGAMAVESAIGNDGIQGMLATLEDADTRARITVERAFLNRLEGGCQVPIGVRTTITGDLLELNGMISSLDGRHVLREKLKGVRTDATGLGERVADELLDRGAADILGDLSRNH